MRQTIQQVLIGQRNVAGETRMGSTPIVENTGSRIVVTATVMATITVALSGCSHDLPSVTTAIEVADPANPTVASNKMAKMAMPRPEDIVFKDHVESNVDMPIGLDGLVFFDTQGKRVALESYLGRKNVVLVFTEGFAGGMLCPFCKTQTSRLVANYDKFAALDTEVLVVYPGAREHLDEFIDAAKTNEKSVVDRIPFPLVLDENLSAVGFFQIASNLAHPSTFIIDKQGDVRLAYVGADMTADRPSIDAMLSVVETANKP
ncbi:MAG: redoxin domain-containing protein [Planctomycetota bacterium]